VNDQDSLFELPPPAEPVSPAAQAGEKGVSGMRDRDSVRRLAALVKKLEAADDPMQRAIIAIEIRDSAEAAVSSSVREVNRQGLTWRKIGREFGVPFQTLYRRYGRS
jgi:DNA invertase Pin-like site-specific DNA recombinase